MRSSRVTPYTVGTPNQWNALHEDARGASRLLAHQMYGTIALPTNPTNGQTITVTINGNAIVLTAVTSISGAPAGSFLIAGTAALTIANAYALLQNPTISNANQVALGANTSANVTLINYVNWSLSGTNLVASSSNFSLYSPVTSFSASTTVTSGSYTANTMALYIEPGVTYINGTEVYFTGGVTPTVTAPSSHPRIDVLSMDNTGTLNWTTGTENASPVTPTYPPNQIPICELYNVVGETALYDQSNQQSGEGYIYNDVRPFLAYPLPLGAVPDSIIPSADGTYNLGSASYEWNNVYAKTSIQVSGVGVAIAKFGGTGTDGSLAITSGTTTISASSAAVLVKNYTSISITSMGTLAFSTPNTNGTIIILKSQGNVTLTSSSTPMINASGMGAAGGAAVTSASNQSGNVGENGVAALVSTNGGSAPTTSGTSTGGAVPSTISIPTTYYQVLMKYPIAYVGGAGSSGAISNGGTSCTSGAGGNGGGCLIIECGGALNFTTANGISVAGLNGGNATEGNPSVAGGGGGGAGGLCIILYNTLTADSGTITVSGGTGGNTGAATSGQTRYGGAGGGSLSAGSNGTSSGSASTKTGGNGANGISFIAINTEFA